MNKKEAKGVAEIISNEQLEEMFDNSSKGITNWTVPSIVNKGLTKGVAWNILARDFDTSVEYHLLTKINMIREFGKFLPNEFKVSRKKEIGFISQPIHQEPIFKK